VVYIPELGLVFECLSSVQDCASFLSLFGDTVSVYTIQHRQDSVTTKLSQCVIKRHAIKAYESTGVAPHISHLGTTWR
jgi:hypothetical protein